MRCELTGKHVRFGNNVSHSNRKTRRTFKVNIKPFTLYSESGKRKLRLKLAVSTLRTIESKGGLDNFLSAVRDANLTPKGRQLKKQLCKVSDAAVQAKGQGS